MFFDNEHDAVYAFRLLWMRHQPITPRMLRFVRAIASRQSLPTPHAELLEKWLREFESEGQKGTS
jgi:hypothetical protein